MTQPSARRSDLVALAGALLLVAFSGVGLQAQQWDHWGDDSEDWDHSRDEASPDPEEAMVSGLTEPSNVGFIDSAIVGDSLRVRYDVAYEGERLDRAEFIYGKSRLFSAFGQDAQSPGPASRVDVRELELAYERLVLPRVSAFIEIPFRSVELALAPGFEQLFDARNLGTDGIGDIRIGIKSAWISAADRHLTVQVRAYLDSGDAEENLGTGHKSIEPALLFFREFPDGFTVETEARWWAPVSGSSDPRSGQSIQGSDFGRIEQYPGFFTNGPSEGPDARVRNDSFAGDVLRFGVGFGYNSKREGFRVSPVFEAIGWYVLNGFATPGETLADFPIDPATLPNQGTFIEDAGDTTIVNLQLGARVRGRGPASFYVGYSKTVTDDFWFDNGIRVEFRRAF